MAQFDVRRQQSVVWRGCNMEGGDKKARAFLYLVSLEIITIYSLQVSSILNCASDGFFTEEEILICIQFHTPVMDDLFELF